MAKRKQLKSMFWHSAYLLKPEMKKFYSTPPGAPALGECKVIEEFIAQKKKYPKILILGATPRFRDLAHRLKTEVTCVDISVDMFRLMVNLMKDKKAAEKETWVKSDWLKMPLRKNYWDFVLGDLVISNLPYKIWDKFFRKIKEVLVPNGFFITREVSLRSAVKDKDEFFLKTLKKFRGKTKFKDISYLTWELVHLDYNPKTHEMSASEMHKIVSRVINALSEGPLKKDLKRLAKELEKVTPGGKIWYGAMKPDLERKFRRFFKIIAIKYGTGHPYIKDCPIYFLKKK